MHFSNLPFSLLQAVKEFLKVLFLDHVKYRDLVLQSLSLVDASLPELHLTSVDLLTVFLRNVHVGGSPSDQGERSMSASLMSPVGGAGAAHVAVEGGASHHPALSKKVHGGGAHACFYCTEAIILYL